MTKTVLSAFPRDRFMKSYRFRFAARLATSVVIAVGLSLALGWERPMWAMFAVIFCDLGDEGESLHKGTMRILGTFLGCALSLLFTALFNDHRWYFGGAVMVWVTICSFMMHDNRRYYFWFLSAWLTILMPIYSAEQPETAFLVVMLRLQETILGVMVFTFVANFVFPDRHRRDFVQEFRDHTRRLKAAFADLIAAWLGGSQGEGSGKSPLELRQEALELHTNFRNRIDVGVIESFDVLENRSAWHRSLDEFDALLQLLNRFRLDISDIRLEDLDRPVPDIGQVIREIERRLDETIAVLGGRRSVDLPRAVALPQIELPADDDRIFTHGAMLVSLETLSQIEKRSAALLWAVADAEGLIGRDVPVDRALHALPRSVIPDPERVMLALRTALIFAAAFSIFIFVPDFPGGPQLILLSTIIGLFVSMKPTIPTPPVELIGTGIILIAGFIHLVILPKVSSFLGLSTILFIYMFVGAALLSSPRIAPIRFISLGFASMILGITNVQEYDFFYVANIVIVFQMPFILLWLTQAAPVSFRPEAAFQRLLRRYMASFRYLVDDIQYDRRQLRDGWWQRQVRAWHLRNLLSIPDQLMPWIQAMPGAAMSEAEKAEARALCESLYDLSGRMLDLNRLRDTRYSAETVAAMRPAIGEWRGALKQLGTRFRETPDDLPSADDLTDSLNAHLSRVRTEVRQLLNHGQEATSSPAGRALLRELSAYHGLSVGLISAVRQATALHWGRIREARF